MCTSNNNLLHDRFFFYFSLNISIQCSIVGLTLFITTVVVALGLSEPDTAASFDHMRTSIESALEQELC